MLDFQKDYTPDFIYNDCRGEPSECTVCSNTVYSRLLNGNVHDVERAKVFCPFGKGESMNLSVFLSQLDLDSTKKKEYFKTKWGHAPQLDPRPLAKIGLEWRTD
jgi:hypothetical protein